MDIWQAMLRGEVDDLRPVLEEERRIGDEQCVGPRGLDGSEGAGEIVETPGRRKNGHDAELLGGALQSAGVGARARSAENGDALQLGNRLLQQLKPLAPDLDARGEGDAGEIVGRMREALHESCRHRIAGDHDDRNGARRSPRGVDARVAAGEDDIDLRRHKLGSERRKAVGVADCPLWLDAQVRAFRVAELAQALEHGAPELRALGAPCTAGIQDADAERPLGERRARQRERRRQNKKPSALGMHVSPGASLPLSRTGG